MLNVKDTVKGLRHGHTTVGTTAVKLTNVERAVKGVRIRAPGADDPVPNTAPVWIGSNDRVTAGSGATGGYPLTPGTEVFIEIEDPNTLFLISTAISQDVAWMIQ